MKKPLLALLFPVVFLCVSVIHTYAQETGKVTLSSTGVSYQDIFSAIKKQTGYSVFYDNSVLNDKEKIKVSFSQTDLSRADNYFTG